MVSAKSKQLSSLNLTQEQLDATCSLLEAKVPVPYMAKFQTHLTGGLRDFQIRQVQAAFEAEQELQQRKKNLTESLAAQNNLSEELTQAIESANNKSSLCDLAYSYRPERRNLSHFAKEGVHKDCLTQLATSFNSLDDYAASIEGADNKDALLKDTAILIADNVLKSPGLVHQLRQQIWKKAQLISSIKKGRENAARMLRENVSLQKSLSAINYQEGLAILRGQNENITEVTLSVATDDAMLALIKQAIPNLAEQSEWFNAILESAFTTYLLPKLSTELMVSFKANVEDKALKPFSKQLHQLITQAPAGKYVTMGIVNGYKAGVKVVVVDANGQVLDSETLFPLYADGNWHDAQVSLVKMITKHDVKSVAIAKKNGAKDLLRLVNELNDTYQDLQLVKLIISDAGAKAFAHSEKAMSLHSDLDEWQREAISIARRLQDPLAELASLPAATIDIGTNQQAINPQKVTQVFHGVLEDAINKLGVDINQANEALLLHVSGLSANDVAKIIAYRAEHGNIDSWQTLQGLGLSEKANAYAGGFIHIAASDNPLDKTFIPPAFYELVERIANSVNTPVAELVANKSLLQQVDVAAFVSEEMPEQHVHYVLRQLERPVQSGRRELKPVQFNSNIKTLSDLKLGDILNGVVGNITTFGAFVNIGIDQDGLIHVSEMPNQAKGRQALLVKTGDVVKVKVIGIDEGKKRLNLSLKLGQQTNAKGAPKVTAKKRKPQKEKAPVNSAMADALRNLKLS